MGTNSIGGECWTCNVLLFRSVLQILQRQTGNCFAAARQQLVRSFTQLVFGALKCVQRKQGPAGASDLFMLGPSSGRLVPLKSVSVSRIRASEQKMKAARDMIVKDLLM